MLEEKNAVRRLIFSEIMRCQFRDIMHVTNICQHLNLLWNLFEWIGLQVVRSILLFRFGSEDISEGFNKLELHLNETRHGLFDFLDETGFIGRVWWSAERASFWQINFVTSFHCLAFANAQHDENEKCCKIYFHLLLWLRLLPCDNKTLFKLSRWIVNVWNDWKLFENKCFSGTF